MGAAVARGVDRDELLALTGFDPGLAADPDARISLGLEERLWNEGARLAGDDAFGLHAAELVRPGMFDVLDYAIRTAPTLRASLERLARYNRLLHDVAVFTLAPKGAALRVEHAFRLARGSQGRHSAEFTLASLMVGGAQILGEPFSALAVEFPHAAPAASLVDEHRRIFGVTPRFSRTCNALELDASLLDRPVPRADPALSRVLERHAEAMLAALPPLAETTGERVKRTLATTLGEGTPTLLGVAQALKLSERSLQRRLADEGVTFEGLLDELRHELALRYLADRKIAVAEVAYLLGYSEPSPFHRAFKRWTGLTPSEARAQAA